MADERRHPRDAADAPAGEEGELYFSDLALREEEGRRSTDVMRASAQAAPDPAETGVMLSDAELGLEEEADDEDVPEYAEDVGFDFEDDEDEEPAPGDGDGDGDGDAAVAERRSTRRLPSRREGESPAHDSPSSRYDAPTMLLNREETPPSDAAEPPPADATAPPPSGADQATLILDREEAPAREAPDAAAPASGPAPAPPPAAAEEEPEQPVGAWTQMGDEWGISPTETASGEAPATVVDDSLPPLPQDEADFDAGYDLPGWDDVGAGAEAAGEDFSSTLAEDDFADLEGIRLGRREDRQERYERLLDRVPVEQAAPAPARRRGGATADETAESDRPAAPAGEEGPAASGSGGATAADREAPEEADWVPATDAWGEDESDLLSDEAELSGTGEFPAAPDRDLAFDDEGELLEQDLEMDDILLHAPAPSPPESALAVEEAGEELPAAELELEDTAPPRPGARPGVSPAEEAGPSTGEAPERRRAAPSSAAERETSGEEAGWHNVPNRPAWAKEEKSVNVPAGEAAPQEAGWTNVRDGSAAEGGQEEDERAGTAGEPPPAGEEAESPEPGDEQAAEPLAAADLDLDEDTGEAAAPAAEPPQPPPSETDAGGQAAAAPPAAEPEPPADAAEEEAAPPAEEEAPESVPPADLSSDQSGETLVAALPEDEDLAAAVQAEEEDRRKEESGDSIGVPSPPQATEEAAEEAAEEEPEMQEADLSGLLPDDAVDLLGGEEEEEDEEQKEAGAKGATGEMQEMLPDDAMDLMGGEDLSEEEQAGEEEEAAPSAPAAEEIDTSALESMEESAGVFDFADDEEADGEPEYFLRILPKSHPLYRALMVPKRLLTPLARRLDAILHWSENWRLYLTTISLLILVICLAVWISASMDTPGGV